MIRRLAGLLIHVVVFAVVFATAATLLDVDLSQPPYTPGIVLFVLTRFTVDYLLDRDSADRRLRRDYADQN